MALCKENYTGWYGFFALFLLLPLSTDAAHIIGGEVTYRCLGYTNGDPGTNSRRYEFTIKLFRDCQGGGSEFDSPNFVIPMHVTFYQGNDIYSVEYLQAPSVIEVDPDPGNPCVVVPTNVCVEEGLYVFVYDLPIVSESYTLVYQRCCRNNTITNIFTPESTGATFAIELTPAAQESCNSSPAFQEYPPAVLCAGQNFVYDFSATDADGDVLVYELCAPYTGGGNSGNNEQPNGISPNPDAGPPYNSVNFLAPAYSPTNPLGAASNLVINPNTGVMTGMPSVSGQFVVGVCVSEFRNGQLLSQVRRDFQFNVTNCENTIFADIQEDSIAMSDGTFILNACDNPQVSVNNQSGQAAFIDGYLWEFFVDNDTITSTAEDFAYTFPGVGSYPGRMIVNPNSPDCSDTAHILINVFPPTNVDFTFAYDTCVAEPVVFSSTIEPAGGQMITSTNWNFGDGGMANVANPEYRFTEPGDFPVALLVNDENGCRTQVTRNVRYFPVPGLIVVAPSDFTGCVPADIFFDNLSDPINDSYTFNWDFGDGGFSDALSPTHRYEIPGLYDVSLEIISPIGCLTDTVFTDLIQIDAAPTAGFTTDPPQLTNFQPTVQITDASEGASRYFYDFNGESTSVMPSPSYSFRDTGQAYITQIVTHPSGCRDSLTLFVDVKPEITFFFPTGFTPNGDGTNDEFRPKGFTRGYRNYQLRVWNRWGEPVYETTDPIQGWNGRKGNVGREQPPGSYLYEATLIGPRGEPFAYRGSVTLIR